MTDDVVAERVFTVDGDAVVCRFFRPEPTGRDFCCRYTIDWSTETQGCLAWGMDGVQALLLAMQGAHVDLLMARKDDAASIVWIDQTSLGLPLDRGLRVLDPQGCF